MLINAIKFVLEMIGLGTVIWFAWIVTDEYRKIQHEHKEKDHGEDLR